MKQIIDDHKRLTVPIVTTPAMKRKAKLISEKVGTCRRNSVKTGTGNSISHGYNAALLLAAKHFGLADLTKMNNFYMQYKSKS